MFNKNIVLGTLSSLLLGLVFYGYNQMIPQEKDEIMTSVSKSKPRIEEIKGLERMNIFRDGEDISNELDPYVLNREGWKNRGESEKKESLRKLVRNRMASLGGFTGWQKTSGKIYYEFNNLSVEVYVLWKFSPLSQNYTHYDRFEIMLTN